MPTTDLEQLSKADQAAAQFSPSGEAGGLAPDCQPIRKAVEVIVLDEEAQPVPDIAVKLRREPSQVLRAKTDSKGWVRFDGLDPGGSFLLSLTALDKEAWEEIRTEALPDEKAKSYGEAPWQPAREQDARKWRTHIVDQGDCTNSIAKEYGFFPDTLWNLPSNGKLRAKRKRATILFPGDLVRIPAPRIRWEAAQAGNLYWLRHKGIPDRLKLRFLNCDGEPRVGIPYTLTIRTFSGEELPVRQGSLDGSGYLSEPVPLDADKGDLVLGNGSHREEYVLEIGRMDPPDTFTGIQDRLQNLGFYSCCNRDTRSHQVTQNAVALWQTEHSMELTGDVWDVQGGLEEDHLS